MIRARDMQALKLPGLRADRVSVLAGGVAILVAVFDALRLDHMDVSDAALRQGVLYDLLGRVQHHDPREATVRQFQRRYHVDSAQAARVAALATTVLRSLAPEPPEHDLALLEWAAALHEIGISIAHAGYHKHSAYILAQADMPGFSQREQARLSLIVLAHRGKLAKDELESLREDSVEWPLVFSLRLAALLQRNRAESAPPPLECRATQAGFELALPRAWLDQHPLTESALEDEAQEWRTLGRRLEVVPLRERRLAGAPGQN
jgi:exopolyphosphatase/guanosine-5'-triphosphate,3'-diphosphate pyrophosphatase